MRIIGWKIGWPDGMTTMRTGASPYWFYVGLPFVYPIFHIFLMREAE